MMDSHRDEIAKLETLYANNPEGRVFTHLAEACRKAGQLERAREILEDGLRRHPDYASAHVVLGRVLHDSGDLTGAANEFRRVLELDRHNLVALRSLGDLAASGQRIEEALYYYGELAVLDPTDLAIQDEIRRLRADLARPTRPAAEAAPAAAPPEAATTLDATATAAAASQVEPPAGLESSVVAEVTGMTGAGTSTEGFEGGFDRVVGSLTIEAEATAETPHVADELTLQPAFPAEPEPAFEPMAASQADTGFAPLGVAAEAPLADEAAAGRDVVEEAAAAAGKAAAEAGAPAEPASPAEAGAQAETEVAEEVKAEAGVEAEARTEAEAAPEAEAAAAAETLAVSEAETGPEGPGELSQAEADATSPAWHEVGARWTTEGPPNPEAERRADLGDPGEWIPAERWEWVAASADLGAAEATGSEAGTAEAEGEDGLELEAIEPAPGFEEPAQEYDIVIEETSIDVAWTWPAEAPEAAWGEVAEESAASDVEAALRTGESALESEIGEAELVPAAEWGMGEEVEPAAGTTWDAMADEDDSGDQVITETLAEIYAAQGLFERAADVYRRLLEHHPEDERLQARLRDLERTPWGAPEPMAEASPQATPEEEAGREAWLERVESAWTGGGGAVESGETPYAWTASARREEASGARVGEFFRSLLSWRPGASPAESEKGPEPAMPVTPEAVAGTVDAGTEGALDDWFSRSAGADEERPGPEPGGDEDLEMFRSWLKSLKK
jgi:tetratricopeptide (TPR) repeat protein